MNVNGKEDWMLMLNGREDENLAGFYIFSTTV
jgi:hypothetical protein